VSKPAKRNNELRVDDYLFEITVRVAVRKKHASAVISLCTSPSEEGDTEHDRVVSAVMDVVTDGLVKHEHMLDCDSSVGRRLSLKEFNVPLS
jgi:hypothetical protein